MTASKSYIKDNIEDEILKIFGHEKNKQLLISKIFDYECCYGYSKNKIRIIFNKMNQLFGANGCYYCIRDNLFINSLNKNEENILFSIIALNSKYVSDINKKELYRVVEDELSYNDFTKF